MGDSRIMTRLVGLPQRQSRGRVGHSGAVLTTQMQTPSPVSELEEHAEHPMAGPEAPSCLPDPRVIPRGQERGMNEKEAEPTTEAAPGVQVRPEPEGQRAQCPGQQAPSGHKVQMPTGIVTPHWTSTQQRCCGQRPGSSSSTRP